MFLFFFSFLLRKNFSRFLKQKASSDHGPAAPPPRRGREGRAEALERAPPPDPAAGRAGSNLDCAKAGVTPPSRWKGGRGRRGGGAVCLLACFVRKRAGRRHTSTGASRLDDGAFGSAEEKGGLSVRARWLDGGSGELSRPGGGPVLKEAGARRGQAPQALLSSTGTARGLTAPARFIWEAAEGASCSFTAPKPGFSSTRCLAC